MSLLSRIIAVSMLVVTVLAPVSAFAQARTVQEIIDALAAPSATSDRGIGRPHSGSAGSAGAAAMDADGQPPKVQLVVGFDGDTHRLTIEGMKTLRMLAWALGQPELQDARLEVVGHAFVAAAPTASLPVSARRAQTVAEHLSGFYGVDPSRLTVRGVGAVEYASPDPADPMNQRIEIVNVGPA